MGMNTGGSRGGVKAEINVTPLVDVVLVLLIIFMVITPMLQDGVDVQLPTTTKPEDQPKDEKNQLTISIKYNPASEHDGADVYVAGMSLKGSDNYKALYELLREEHERSPGKEILIKSDRRLQFGIVKKVMKACNQMGFEQVSLIAERNVI